MTRKPQWVATPWFIRGHLRHRWREIVSTFTRHGLGWLVTGVGQGDLIPFERGWLGHPRREAPYTRPEHLHMALGELGATFIKLGQMLSTRSDLLPPDYINELTRLQDAAPPVPFEQICQIICDELGQRPEAIFDDFDPQPVASASIGQAHAGKLKNGQAVVVKVQRPNVSEQVNQDLEILFGIAGWLETNTAFGRHYNVSALVDEFAYTLRNELDYRREGQNADRFRRNFAEDSGISIPQIYWEFTTARVLTLERVSGIKIAEVSLLDDAGISRQEVAQNAVRVMLREIFEFGFFHADPHPGNFFVRSDASIALIDFGMVGRVDSHTQTALLRLGLALVQQDAARLTNEFYNLGVVGKGVNRAALQRDLDHLLSQYAGLPIEELAASQVTGEIFSVALRNQLQLPGDLVMLLRAIGMSESLGARLDSDFRLFEFAAPYLRRYWLQQLSPKALRKRMQQAALDATDLGADLPRALSGLLRQLEHGEFEVSVTHEGLDELTRQLRRMANRLALAILLAATIVALGLLMLVYHPPEWERYGGWVFGLSFLLTLVLGLRMMISIWWSNRH